MRTEDANNEILKLFSQGLTSRQLLVLAAHYRRLDLEKSLCKQTNKEIISGIFKGIKHTGEAMDLPFAPKYLEAMKKK